MKQELKIKNLNGLNEAAKRLLDAGGTRRVFAFSGEMGAGKTTFIKSICNLLGVTDTTASPTFSLVNEYAAPSGEKIYHFDFYRIKKEDEAFDLGYEEYFYSGNYCFIEWPEKISALLPPGVVQVTIRAQSEERIITIQTP